MNLVDSSGWIEYFVGGTQADQFSKSIEQTEKLIVPTIVIYEVFKFLVGKSEERHAWGAIATMHLGEIAPLDADIALQAAQMSLQLKLPMADSIILATAKGYGATIWTQDADFKEFENVKFIDRKN